MQINLFEKVPPQDIYNFTRQLSVMLKAGVPLVDALDSVHSDQTNQLLNRTIDMVIDDVSGGLSLSKAMEKGDLSAKALAPYEQAWKSTFPPYHKILKGKDALYNLSDEEMTAMAAFIHEIASGREALLPVEILRMHHLGRPKYDALGTPYPALNLPEPEPEKVRKFIKILQHDKITVSTGG